MQTAVQRGIATVKFVIDAAASRFSVQAFSSGILSSFGHNPVIGINGLNGEIQFDAVTYNNCSLRIALKTGELEVLDEMKKGDRKKLEQLMYGQVLDVANFPEAVYQSKKIVVETLSKDLLLTHVSGELSFHGVTQPEGIDARVADLGDMLRIYGEFSLNQSDYGIKPVSFAGGALKLKDELKFKFVFVARKQD